MTNDTRSPRSHTSRHPRLRPRLTALVMFVAFLLVLALERGLLTPTYIPLPRLDLAAPKAVFMDWKIARLSADRDHCRAILTPPFIAATPIEDQPPSAGCGWTNAVKVASVAGARLGAEQVSCQTAAALALWMTHVVQPATRDAFGKPVAAIHHLGVYACRNIAGGALFRHVRSQHASANALDITGFTLGDGRRISLLKHWTADGAEAAFLRRIRDGACPYFRVVLSPDYNAAHRDHFHLDRGYYRACR